MNDSSSALITKVTRWVMDIIVTLCLAGFLVWSFGTRVTIDGHSMESALEYGDVLMLNKLSYYFTDIERFDIIYFSKENSTGSQSSVKRVVGLPGETVQIINGDIFINGSILTIDEGMSGYTVAGLAEEPLQLHDDEYFLLGDNGDSSEDSRFSAIGKVSRSEIIGSVWFRITPLRKIGPVGP